MSTSLRYTLRHRAARPAIVAAACGCVLWVAASSLPNAGLFDTDQVGDTPAYRNDGEAALHGEIPYRDYYVEYPPGALPVFVLPAAGPSSGYAARFKVLMLALGAALTILVVAAVARARRPARHMFAAAALVGAMPALLGPVVLVNFDLWPATLATGAIVALASGRHAAAGALLAGGTAAKIYPVVLLPLALMHAHAGAGPRAARRCAVAFGLVLLAVIAPFAALGPGGVRTVVENVLRRPLQIESLGSSLLLVTHRLGLYSPSVNSDYNSQNLGGALPSLLAVVLSLVMVAALAAVAFLFFRRPRDTSSLFGASAAAVVAVVAFGKVLSPQFLVWLAPLVALVGSAGASALLALAFVLTQLWFPSHYGDVVALGRAGWLVFARDLVLVALFAVLLRRLRRVVPPETGS